MKERISPYCIVALAFWVSFIASTANATSYRFFPTGSLADAQALCMSSESYQPISDCQTYGSRVVNQCRLTCDTWEAYTTGVKYCYGVEWQFAWQPDNTCDLVEQYIDHYTYPVANCPSGTVYIGPGPSDCASATSLNESGGNSTSLGPDNSTTRPDGKEGGCQGNESAAVSLPTPASAKRGNPCDASNGNKYLEREDFVGGDGVPTFTRYYNSNESRTSSLGYGWTHNHSMRLEKVSDNLLHVVRGSGRAESFTKNPDQTWSGGNGTRYRLQEDLVTHEFILSHRDGSFEKYDPLGNLITQSDGQGRLTQYTYYNNRLQTVTGPYGHKLVFTYFSSGLLNKVQIPSGKYLVFTYSNNNQTSVTYPYDGSVALKETYHYENSSFLHHLTGITDENNLRFATYAYDATGRAISTEHAGGTEKFSFFYGENETIVTDADNYAETLTFETIAGIKRLKSALSQTDGKAFLQSYDTAGRLKQSTDPNNVVTKYNYNSAGQFTGLTEAFGKPEQRETTLTYASTAIDLPNTITYPSVSVGHSKSVTIGYTHPSLKLPTSIAIDGFKPNGTAVHRETAFSYDNDGRVLTTDGPRTDISDITAFTYNNCNTGQACGQLATMTNALGQITTFNSYDNNGRLAQFTDPAGTVVNLAYNARGQLITRTESRGVLNRIWRYDYTKTGLPSKITDPDGVYTNFGYNAAHQLISATDTLGHSLQFGYDNRGNRTVVDNKDATNTLLTHTQLLFDHRGRPTSVATGISTTQKLWDAVGNLLSETDANNHETQWTYDPFGNVKTITNALLDESVIDHDIADRLASHDAPNGAGTEFIYDDLGNLLKEISADRGATEYAYDAAGNLISRTDANNISVSFVYDALNRVKEIHYPNAGENIVYAYDTCRIGELCSADDASGSTDFHYDDLGRVNETVFDANSGSTYTTGYTWTLADRLSGMTYPGGRQVSYGRNGNGLIQSVTTTINGQPLNVLSNRLYRGDGQWSEETFGNGLIQTRIYDDRGLPSDDNLGTINLRHNSFDAKGNLTSKTDAAGQIDYSYDAIDQIKTESVSSVNSYQYDANGNRLNKSGVGYTYELASNRLTGKGGQAVITDPAGQITATGNFTLLYTGAGQIDHIDQQGTELVRYRYNHSGLRSEKTLSGNTTTYLYDLAGNLIGESTGSGLSRAYLYAGNTPIAQIDAGDVITYLHTDHLGTPRIGTNEIGNAEWRWDGEAFGASAPVLATRTVNLRFPGQYFDVETGFHYNNQRYYDPATGRYLISDPIGLAGGANTFAYVENKTLNYTDSSGLIIDIALDIVSLDLSIQVFNHDPSLSNGIGLAYDALATALPGLPAGFGIVKQIGKKSSSLPNCPGNMSPNGAGRKGAFNEAKRQSGIPTSQKPSKVLPNTDKRGKPQPGRIYEYEVPTKDGGTRTVRIRDDAGGHDYGPGNIQNRGPHFNDESGNHYDY